MGRRQQARSIGGAGRGRVGPKQGAGNACRNFPPSHLAPPPPSTPPALPAELRGGRPRTPVPRPLPARPAHRPTPPRLSSKQHGGQLSGHAAAEVVDVEHDVGRTRARACLGQRRLSQRHGREKARGRWMGAWSGGQQGAQRRRRGRGEVVPRIWPCAVRQRRLWVPAPAPRPGRPGGRPADHARPRRRLWQCLLGAQAVHVRHPDPPVPMPGGEWNMGGCAGGREGKQKQKRPRGIWAPIAESEGGERFFGLSPPSLSAMPGAIVFCGSAENTREATLRRVAGGTPHRPRATNLNKPAPTFLFFSGFHQPRPPFFSKQKGPPRRQVLDARRHMVPGLHGLRAGDGRPAVRPPVRAGL